MNKNILDYENDSRWNKGNFSACLYTAFDKENNYFRHVIKFIVFRKNFLTKFDFRMFISDKDK